MAIAATVSLGGGNMRIYFERTGGFTGLSLRTAVDTAVLPEEDARSLQEMVNETQFFELPADLDGNDTVDAFNYTLTVETDGRRHTVHTSEMHAPDALQPLLRRLTVLARMHPQPDDRAVSADSSNA